MASYNTVGMRCASSDGKSKAFAEVYMTLCGRGCSVMQLQRGRVDNAYVCTTLDVASDLLTGGVG